MSHGSYKRRCSECNGTISSRSNAKTCSTSCRARRSRRLKRTKADNGRARALPDHQAQIADAVRNEAPDIAHVVIQEALEPVVREALTEDVMRSIRSMIGLAPVAVQALANDLQSEDSKVRQKAYDLWLRYTVGHSAIVRPEEENPQGMQVFFNLPRPSDSPGTEALEVVPAEAEELRTCGMCAQEKSADQFVGSSDRCNDCHAELAAKAAELLGES